MYHIGHLGSSVLLVPASLVLIFILAWEGRRRDGLAVAAALCVCLAATLIAKLGFRTCSFDPSAIESPSGHASFSTMFYGCCAMLVAGGRPPAQRIAIYAGTAALVAAIGVSRVLVYAHSWAEVGVGAVIGLLALATFALLRGPPHRVRLASRRMLTTAPVLVTAGLVVLLMARQWTPEPFIARAAEHLDRLLQVCS